MKKPVSPLCPTRLLLLSVFLMCLANVADAQNCNVNFPGTANINFSTACGATPNNVVLGDAQRFGNGDVLTFDADVTISGNLQINASGSGRIIIPSGVDVNVDGNVQLNTAGGGCVTGNPCVFEIVVTGTLHIGSSNFANNLTTLVWSGTGTVIFDDQFQNNACMQCGTGGCPAFQGSAADCVDNGSGCAQGDFCNTIIPCLTDVTKPTITGCPSNLTANMTGPGCTQVVNWTAPTAQDNCTLASFTSTHNPGFAFPKGVTTVTYTATDAKGNVTTCSFTVTVNDVIFPVITACPANIIANTTTSCGAVVNWTAPTFSDNCTGATLVAVPASGSTFPVGTTPVTYTATDASGNKSTCTFNVTVNDVTPPVITACPANITSNTTTSCGAVVNWTAPAFSDNCTGATLVAVPASGSTFPVGTTPVTYTATDASGNKSTCTFNVTVNDVTPPVITACPANITVNTTTLCGAVVNWTAPTFSDNCTGATLVAVPASGSTFPVGTTPVTYTATDASGNKATCTFNVTVNDVTPPVITSCPANITANTTTSCGAVVTWTAPPFSDNCTGATLVAVPASGSTFPVGTTPVTYTATDASGNKATCTFNVTVNDVTPPVITACPANITANTTTSCGAVVNWTAPTFSDNCTGATLVAVPASGSTFPVGTTPVTYTATDASGNKSTCTFNVTVKDVTPPVITSCPANITVNTTGSCGAVVNWTAPTFTDNCTGATLVAVPASGSTFSVGTTTVTYTLTDASGNKSTCSFTVTVVDNTPPVFSSCPTEIRIPARSQSCDAVVTWVVPVATDNCSTVTLTSTHNPGSTFPIATTVVKYTATDQAGNSASCEFRVVVTNETVPVISGCPGNLSARADESGEVAVTWVEPTAMVACGDVTLEATHRPGDFFPVGETEVTYTATTPHGKTATCSFEVKVSAEIQFSIAPLITPNGDGTNDYWELENIEKFSNNSVVVVDRWGTVVYKGSGYNNNDVVWRGENRQGGAAPTGTYFYRISIDFLSQKEEKRGSVELVR